MLQAGISLNDICFCSNEKLAQIAQSLSINSSDLKLFANEVVKSIVQKVEQAKREILITDDESSITRKMMDTQAIQSRPLSKLPDDLRSDFQIVFRIRSELLAKRCGQILNRKIEATKEGLPVLEKGHYLIILSDQLSAHWSDPEAVYFQRTYIPE